MFQTFVDGEGTENEDEERKDNDEKHGNFPAAEEPAEQRAELFLLPGGRELGRLADKDRDGRGQRIEEAIVGLVNLLALLLLLEEKIVLLQ